MVLHSPFLVALYLLRVNLVLSYLAVVFIAHLLLVAKAKVYSYNVICLMLALQNLRLR